jgi:hypothetical protein
MGLSMLCWTTPGVTADSSLIQQLRSSQPGTCAGWLADCENGSENGYQHPGPKH